MNLKEKYQKEIVPAMREKFGYKNALAVPSLQKVTLNIGVRSDRNDEQFVTTMKETLRKISGQQAVETKARKSIAGFKIRQGQTVGLKVTLRGTRMYDFVDKLVNVTLPRVRDFRGLASKSVDKVGNLTVGFREHLPFPEVNPDEVDKLHGLEAVITLNTKTHDEGLELLRLMGFPFKKENR
jgi:large subunit ribosomal protein L5